MSSPQPGRGETVGLAVDLNVNVNVDCVT
jgi:hypothetical protein